jgi:hypothetical protein
MERLSVSAPRPGTEHFTASLHAQRDHLCQLLAGQQTRLEQAETLVQRELQRLEEELSAQRAEADRLRTEHDLLSVRLSHAEPRSAKHAKRLDAHSGDDSDSGGDYQRRYEMALEDLRDLKTRNAELQQQLTTANATAAAVGLQGHIPSGRLDWEAEKRRIFAALDADFDTDDPQQCADRLKIENVLRTTQQVIADKDCQIVALQQQLEEQCARQAADESHQAALDQAVNADAIIQQERERLVDLQKEWQEKLRHAEIEISLERAKLARQRAEIEEQVHRSEKESAKSTIPGSSAGPGQRSTTGQWLARLGLTEADRERRRHL